MKKTIFLFALLFSLSLHAQQPKIETSNAFQIAHPKLVGDLVAADDKYYYYINFYQNNRKADILKIDRTGSITEEFAFDSKSVMKGFELTQIKKIDGQVYLFGFLEDKSDKKFKIYAVPFVKGTLTLGEPIVLSEYNDKIFKYGDLEYATYGYENEFEIIPNTDKTSFALVANAPINGLRSELERTVTVFNSKFEKQQPFKIEIPKKFKFSKIDYYVLESNGDFLLSGKGFKEYSDARNENDEQDFVMVYNGGKLLFQTVIESTSNNIIKTKIALDKESYIVAGIYSKKSDKEERPLGIVIHSYDKTGKKLFESLNPFSEEYNKHIGVNYKEFGNISVVKNGHKFWSTITIEKIMSDKDGNIYVFTEEYSKFDFARGPHSYTRYFAKNNTNLPCHTYSGEKLVLKTNSSGKSIWQTYIPSWLNVNGRADHLKVISSNNKMYLLYTTSNEYAESDIKAENIEPKKYTSFAICAAEIDPSTGSVKKYKINDGGSNDNDSKISSGFFQDDKLLFINQKSEKETLTNIQISQIVFK